MPPWVVGLQPVAWATAGVLQSARHLNVPVHARLLHMIGVAVTSLTLYPAWHVGVHALPASNGPVPAHEPRVTAICEQLEETHVNVPPYAPSLHVSCVVDVGAEPVAHCGVHLPPWGVSWQPTAPVTGGVPHICMHWKFLLQVPPLHVIAPLPLSTRV